MPKPLRILLLEDSEDDAELLLAELRLNDYEPIYKREQTAEALRAALAGTTWDIVISDYSMPRFNAPAALKIVQDAGIDIPFIIVSGVIGEESAVAAMKAGAHDYLMKGKLARLAPAIERELREAEVRRAQRKVEKENSSNLERIRALHEIDKAINSTLDLPAVLALLLEKIELFMPFSAATTIRLINRASGTFENTACRNLNECEWKNGRGRNTGQLSREVFESKSLVVIKNIQTATEAKASEFFRKNGFVSYLGVPLIAKDEIVGILGFYTKDLHEFTDQETNFLLPLASQAAIAIHNSQLYQQTTDQALELKRANEVKDQFLSVISHELRTPLNLIMGYTATVKDGLFGETNEDQANALQKVLRHSKDLLSMITNILHATRIEANEVRVQCNPFSLTGFLKDLKRACDHWSKHQLAIVWDYPPELPQVVTDSEKLTVILQNLIDNAVKFTEAGEVRISARIKKTAGYGANSSNSSEIRLEFTVADTGIGIPQEKLPVIFKLFRQADSSETRRHGGMGLGLYTSKRFVELLGGVIVVDTKLGQGAMFKVSIPCQLVSSSNSSNGANLT